MSLEEDVVIARATCPCWLAPWGATKCRNCSMSREHHLDHCEWRGHAAIKRVVQMTRFDALRRINRYVDRDPAISREVRNDVGNDRLEMRGTRDRFTADPSRSPGHAHERRTAAAS